MIAVVASVAMNAQSISIEIGASERLPGYGLGSDGQRYFVMRPEQERTALIAVVRSLYSDSLILAHDDAFASRAKEIAIMNGQINDLTEVHTRDQATIHLLDENVEDIVAIAKDQDATIVALNRKVKQGKVKTWIAVVAGVAAVVLVAR